MRRLGRALQLLGLILLPIATMLELTRAFGPSFGVRHMLIMLVFGGAVFTLGWLLQGYGQRS